MEELKPCPFCGEKPSFLSQDANWGYSYAKIILACVNKDCEIAPKTQWQDIEAWDQKRGTYFLDMDEIKKGLLETWNKRFI